MLVIRRFLPAILRRTLSQKRQTAKRKVYEASLNAIIPTAPYVAVFVGFYSFLYLLGFHGRLGYRFAVICLFTFLIYGILLNAFKVLLGLRAPETRIIPLTDETSAYVWVWVKRFLKLSFLLYFATRSMDLFEFPVTISTVIQGILILFFPFLSTVLLLQIWRMRGPVKKKAASKTYWGVLRSLHVRFWPIAALAAIWVFSIFAVTGYYEGIRLVLVDILLTIMVFGIVRVLLPLINSLFDRLFGLSEEIKRRFPGLEEKTNRHIGTMRNIIKWVVFGIAIGTVLEFWGLRTSWFVTSELGSAILSRAITIGIAIGVMAVIVDLIGSVARHILQPRRDENGRIIEVGRKKRTLIPLGRWVITVVVLFVGCVFILNRFGLEVMPFLAGAGILGLAIGWGSQSLVRDCISGIFILLEDSVAVGDVVEINKKEGVVESVTLRTIKFRDVSGTLHVIPNGWVRMLSNMTKDYSRYVFDVPISYKEDVDQTTAVLKGIGDSMMDSPEFKDDILEPLEILGVDKLAETAATIKARITTKPAKQWRVAREFNRRMKNLFGRGPIEKGVFSLPQEDSSSPEEDATSPRTGLSALMSNRLSSPL